MIRTARRPLAVRPALGVTAGVALATVLLAGCSSGSTTGTASASGSKAASSSSGAAARARFAGAGLAGPITSVGSGSFTLKAASGSSDTVDWGSATTFDRTAAGTLADVAPGSCVAVTEASGSDASTGSVDASSVRVSKPVDGSCTAGAAAGFPGGARRSPSGTGGGYGGGSGSGARPSGGGLGGGAARSMLAGSVDSVTTTGFIVDVVTPAGGSGSTGATTTTSVTVSTATTYTVTTPATSGDLAVGECARVFSGARPASSASATPTPSGSASAAGPVTAVSVTLSAPVDGSCPAPVQGTRAAGGATGGSGATA